jgi:predicted ATPase
MINKVGVQYFKCLRDVTADLERFTVFVGPNASGKSSILQALDILCRAFRPQQVLQPIIAENELIWGMSRGADGPVELLAMVGDAGYRYRTSNRNVPPQHAHSAKWGGEGPGFLATEKWKPWRPSTGKVESLPMSVLLRLEASKLKEHSPAPNPTEMSPEGFGLHSALASMALNDPDSWQQLQADLRRIIPTIGRLRHTATRANQPPSLLFDTLGADSLPASQVSEGTLLVLGLLTALYAPNRPSLILLDDLDRGLHPRAQKELITLLRGLLTTSPNRQIVATTHSPYMLDCMDVNEVRMTFLKEDDGATVCAPLTSHPKYPKWKDEMTPGEMWSLFGEKWVAEEVPA